MLSLRFASKRFPGPSFSTFVPRSAARFHRGWETGGGWLTIGGVAVALLLRLVAAITIARNVCSHQSDVLRCGSSALFHPPGNLVSPCRLAIRYCAHLVSNASPFPLVNREPTSCLECFWLEYGFISTSNVSLDRCLTELKRISHVGV